MSSTNILMDEYINNITNKVNAIIQNKLVDDTLNHTTDNIIRSILIRV